MTPCAVRDRSWEKRLCSAQHLGQVLVESQECWSNAYLGVGEGSSAVSRSASKRSSGRKAGGSLLRSTRGLGFAWLQRLSKAPSLCTAEQRVRLNRRQASSLHGNPAASPFVPRLSFKTVHILHTSGQRVPILVNHH